MNSAIKSAAFPEPFIINMGKSCFRTWLTASVVSKSPSATIVRTGTFHSTDKMTNVFFFFFQVNNLFVSDVTRYSL